LKVEKGQEVVFVSRGGIFRVLRQRKPKHIKPIKMPSIRGISEKSKRWYYLLKRKKSCPLFLFGLTAPARRRTTMVCEQQT
jgi:hypothetical protein